MSIFLYQNFLEDKQEYSALRAFWVKRLRELMPPGQEYAGYANDRYVDGTLFYDGNPIASVINWSNRHAVRIVQGSPSEHGECYVSWTSDVNVQRTERSRPVPVAEKVIALTLTKNTLERSLNEIREWLHAAPKG